MLHKCITNDDICDTVHRRSFRQNNVNVKKMSVQQDALLVFTESCPSFSFITLTSILQDQYHFQTNHLQTEKVPSFTGYDQPNHNSPLHLKLLLIPNCS